MSGGTGFVVPFPLPTWTGVASITGRIITRLSGPSFTDGYPRIGLVLEIDPSVFDGIVGVQKSDIDKLGKLPDAFHVWFVDGDHMETDIDATNDLLIPAGTAAPFRIADYIWPKFNSAICWVSGNDVTSNPNSPIRTAHPTIAFGGDSFGSASSSLTAHPTVFLEGIQPAKAQAECAVQTVNNASDITLEAGVPDGVYQAIWQSWGTSAPPIGPTAIKAIDVGAHPTGGSGGPGSGWTMYARDEWQFVARVRGNTTIDTTVTWSCTAGLIDPTTGAYTAPDLPISIPGAYVTATSNQDGITSATVGFQFYGTIGKTVDINPGTYTPPAGWKLDGGPGKLIWNGFDGVHPYAERRIISPV